VVAVVTFIGGVTAAAAAEKVVPVELNHANWKSCNSDWFLIFILPTVTLLWAIDVVEVYELLDLELTSCVAAVANGPSLLSCWLSLAGIGFSRCVGAAG